MDLTVYIVASGDLSKNFTRKLIFLVTNATVLVAVWSPEPAHISCLFLNQTKRAALYGFDSLERTGS